ncbi:hypothetical protein Hanom_Chr05g00395401 [Helianthus anomalus]
MGTGKGTGTPNFQIHQQGLQRSPSMLRASHVQQQQQQYGLGAGNMNAARVYGQVSFGSGQQHNQQNQQMGLRYHHLLRQATSWHHFLLRSLPNQMCTISGNFVFQI